MIDKKLMRITLWRKETISTIINDKAFSIWFIESTDSLVDIERSIFARGEILKIIILVMSYIEISNRNDGWICRWSHKIGTKKIFIIPTS
jgi:hypothetical protein